MIRPTSPHSTNGLVFIVGKQCVYCVLQPELLNLLKLKSFFMGLIKAFDIVTFSRPIRVNYIILEFAIVTVVTAS
jgi:hypothetical protein